MEWAYLLSVAVATVLATTRFLLARKTKQPHNALSAVATLLLIAPVFWALKDSGTKGRRANPSQCVSNVKHLALAMIMYSNDNNDFLPASRPLTSVARYLRPTQEMSCPRDAAIRYGFNRALLGSNLVQLQNPASVLMIAETARQDELVEKDADLAHQHAGQVALAFADAHARRVGVGGTKVFWRTGQPVQFQLISPPLDPSPLFRRVWNWVLISLYFGGVPVSILLAFLSPKGSPRRQFWALASCAWAVVFFMFVVVPVQ